MYTNFRELCAKKQYRQKPISGEMIDRGKFMHCSHQYTGDAVVLYTKLTHNTTRGLAFVSRAETIERKIENNGLSHNPRLCRQDLTEYRPRIDMFY